MILLDADVVVDVIRARPPAVHSWSSLGAQEIAVPGYVALELVDGCQNARDLAVVNRLLARVRIIWIDEDQHLRALDTYKQIRLATALDPLDMLIARTALVLALPLHTFNQKHFNAVPGLLTVQPYVR